MGPIESDEVGALKAKVNHLEIQAATATPPPAALSVYEMNALKRCVKQLEAQLAAAAKPVPALVKGPDESAPRQPRTAHPHSLSYECGEPGHFGRDCHQRAARLAREVAATQNQPSQ